MIAAHADWAVDPRKRWVCVARRTGRGWAVEAPCPVGDPTAFAAAMTAEGTPACLGLDLPLGLPRAYAQRRAEAGFVAFLAARAGDTAFFEVNGALETVCDARPFYPARPAKGMTRLGHALALDLGGAHGLSRLCDRATALRPAGAPLFWTLGANQSGKAAIAAWRDWLAPALAAGAPYALWPFDGPLASLLAPGRLVLAEVYPAEALRQLGLRMPGSKRSHAARASLAPDLLAVAQAMGANPARGLVGMAEAGFGTDAAGEDRLDCVLGLLALLAVLDGARADFVPDDPWVRRWEGWVLGQAELPNPVA